MKHRLEILLGFTLTLLIFQNVVHAQEKGFATWNDKKAGFSVSYPDTWTQTTIFPASLPYARLFVNNGKNDANFIGFLIQAQILETNPISDVASYNQQVSNFLDSQLKDPKDLIPVFGNPTIIKKGKTRFASKNGIFLQVENTAPAVYPNPAYKKMSLIYATVNNGILYGIVLECHTVYFAQNKSIMEKVAASFSLRNSNVGNSSNAVKPSPKKKKVVRRKKN